MTSESSPRTPSIDERAYLYARVVYLVIVIGLQAFGLTGTGSAESNAMTLSAVAGLTILTLGVFAAVFWWRTEVKRVMLFVLGPDILLLSAFVYLDGDGDVFYPVCILLPIVYSLVVRKREIWMVGAASAIAYMVAQVFFLPFTAAAYVSFALKALAIPLIGALVASSVAKQHEREAEVERAIAANREINERLKRRVAELQAVSEITEVIHSSLDFDAVGPVVLDIVAKLVDIESCCLFVIDKQSAETIFSASVGSVDYNVGQGVDGQMGLLDGHFLCKAVFDRSEIMVLFCASAEDVELLSEEDGLVVSAVASELVVAVENSRLYKLTKRLAITDELTGLFNYRHLQQRLDDETGRARRYGKNVSLLMIDIDDFKHFNDTYGHIAGDTALAELASVLRTAVREVDVVARYGGEEFSVVLPETDAAGAYVVADKAREAISLHRFVVRDGERECALTVSIGVATYPTHAPDKESLLREADDALYMAKNGGKNRVRTPRNTTTLASDPVTPTGD